MLKILLIIFVLVLLLGVRRLPAIGTALGKAAGNFKKAYRDTDAIDVTPGRDDDQRD